MDQSHRSLNWEDLLEKEMATHPSILAWKIPWTEEPGGLQFMGSQKSWTRLCNYTTMNPILWNIRSSPTLRQKSPGQVTLSENSVYDRGALLS